MNKLAGWWSLLWCAGNLSGLLCMRYRLLYMCSCRDLPDIDRTHFKESGTMSANNEEVVSAIAGYFIQSMVLHSAGAGTNSGGT